MKLIVDSGSTKTDWISVDKNGSKIFETQTLGLNPQVLTSNIIEERVINYFELYQNRKKIINISGMSCANSAQGIKKHFNKINLTFEIKKKNHQNIQILILLQNLFY